MAYYEIAIVNSYFDSGNVEQTVGKFLTQEFEYAVTMGQRVDADIYIQPNTLIVKDGIIQIGSGTK
jgi:hypothetical protein